MCMQVLRPSLVALAVMAFGTNVVSAAVVSIDQKSPQQSRPERESSSSSGRACKDL